MQVKLKKEMVKKYWFHLGGDMSETMGIAIDPFGNPISYKEFMEKGGSVKPIHILELDKEFLVVNHDNPITRRDYEGFKDFFEEDFGDEGRRR